MAAALALARRALGTTWPNPSVGCVIVKHGTVLARAATAPGGRPHAESQALAIAGEDARGACAYVSLEPCAHHGATPPCAEALIEAGVARVVVACRDPDPRVSGRGLAMLRAAGITVVEGPGAATARYLNAGFFSRITRRRPLVTLKTATSLDGRIALASGESRWITGEAARAFGHLLRAQHDAVLIGSGTALADDPALTVRLPGLSTRRPVRIVIDSAARLPSTGQLAQTASEYPVWLIHAEGGAPDVDRRAEGLAAQGVVTLAVPADHGRVDLAAALGLLGSRGLTRILVESGGVLAASLLKAGLVDRVAWFRSPTVIGGDGRPAIGALDLASLAASPRWRRREARCLGEDLLESLECCD